VPPKPVRGDAWNFVNDRFEVSSSPLRTGKMPVAHEVALSRMCCVPLACRQWEVGAMFAIGAGSTPKQLRGKARAFVDYCFEVGSSQLRTGRMPVAHGVVP
jgi:hypothetical protein